MSENIKNIYKEAYSEASKRVVSPTKKIKEYPENCPITNRPFFMVIGNEEGINVPTYGGPYDSYTIPEIDDEGDYVCQRFDHDNGCWSDDQQVYVKDNGWTRLRDKFPEDTDNVLWCKFPVNEPCYCGSMADVGFLEDYYTHWMPHPEPPLRPS